MKKILALQILIILFAHQYCFSQSNFPKLRNCATEVPDENWEKWFTQKVDDYKKSKAVGLNEVVTYKIPVVVHILHSGDATGANENISLAQVQSQINILNADFAGTNSDIGSVPSVFASAKAGNTGISFCLAKTNSNGGAMAEEGVDRVNWQAKGWQDPNSFNSGTALQSYINSTIKPNTIWDPKKYLNIWVMEMSNSGLLGFASFPAGSNLSGIPGVETATTCGVVINFKAFGNLGTALPPFNKGRTATHEVGHWLGLRHIWGDGFCKTDQCGDTPPASEANYGCKSHPFNLGVCNGNTTGEMFMNYMDYSDDACILMFTKDQATRMQTAMQNGTYRSTLSFSGVCNAPSSSPSYNLKLYNYVSPSPTNITFANSFSVSTNIANYGTGGFTGDYCAAVFDENYKFVDYIETKTNFTLQAGNAYSNNLKFETQGIIGMLPGDYHIGIFFRPTGGAWVQVSDNGVYKNLVSVSVVNPKDIEIYSSILITSGPNLVQSQPISVNLDIVNDGISTFKGQYQVNLYNLDGSFAETIATINENNGLPAGYHYSSPYLTFSKSALSSKPGQYYLGAMYKTTSGSFTLAGSSYFQNPIRVNVLSPSPDIYEQNNTTVQAYTLPLSFSGNIANSKTPGSNFHIITDTDFYKISLPEGFNYIISPRLHDSYRSDDGKVYSVDGAFSYSTDLGVTWSETMDDIMPNTILVSGGNQVIFKVESFYQGETGTYLFDIQVARVPYQFEWTGTVSSDWFNINNWSGLRLPTISDDIIIKGGGLFSPKISSGKTGVCRSLKAEPGAEVRVEAGGKLNIMRNN